MERLADFNLSGYTKEDLLDLLDEHPTLFEMTDGELTAIARDKCSEAQGLINQANGLEGDADAIYKYIIARREKLVNK